MEHKNETSNFSPEKTMVTPAIVAAVVGCSPVMVRKVLTGQRNQDTDLAQRVQIADTLLKEGVNKLLMEVNRVCKF